MTRLGRSAAVVALVFVLTWLAAPASRADTESVRHLDATFAIQADGSIDVRYELDWHFPETGRHGINFEIATREPWEDGVRQDVVYDVSNVRVSSPSGAPTKVRETEVGGGSRTGLELRIGDPAVELDTQDATYVIEYELSGALRTFDGKPQFFWDVVSEDYPLIEELTVTVTAPDGVDRARCLVGDEECGAEMDGGAAMYSASGVRRATSVVAELPDGSVRNAEPVLEPQALVTETLYNFDGEATVNPDGTVDVVMDLVYGVPIDQYGSKIRLEQPVRQPWSKRHDQVISITDLEAVDADGQPLTTDVDSYSYRESSWDASSITVTLDPEPVTEQTTRALTVSYTLQGTVGAEDGVARVRMPVEPETNHTAETFNWTWTLPGDATDAGCITTDTRGRISDTCGVTYTLDGDTVRTDLEGVGLSPSGTLTDITLPAELVPGAVTEFEPSRTAAVARRPLFGGGIAVGGAALWAGLYALLRKRDQRYVGVPPGVVGDPSNVTFQKRTQPPVQFHPPEVGIVEAGLLLDRTYKPAHLSAKLVDMAVADVLRLKTGPLVVQKGPTPPRGMLEDSIRRKATARPSRLGETAAREMREAAISRQRQLSKGTSVFHKGLSSYIPTLLGTIGVLAIFGGPAAWVLYGIPLPYSLGLMAAGMAATFVAQRPGWKRLSAEGSAKLDQVEGFRQYIATAEAEQLNYEADRDIFRRYLPWAVLFGETERWVKIGQWLESTGRIDPIDTAFIGGASLQSLPGQLSSFTSSVKTTSAPPSSSSSGGSGGSSGFSRSSSGGGGGGGTSASSW